MVHARLAEMGAIPLVGLVISKTRILWPGSQLSPGDLGRTQLAHHPNLSRMGQVAAKAFQNPHLIPVGRLISNNDPIEFYEGLHMWSIIPGCNI